MTGGAGDATGIPRCESQDPGADQVRIGEDSQFLRGHGGVMTVPTGSRWTMPRASCTICRREYAVHREHICRPRQDITARVTPHQRAEHAERLQLELKAAFQYRDAIRQAALKPARNGHGV